MAKVCSKSSYFKELYFLCSHELYEIRNAVQMYLAQYFHGT